MAARFWVGQSGGGNYSSTDWALTTGGTTGQATPTSSDDVHFDGAGTFGNTACTITATANALTVIFTSGYTSTLTISANFTWIVAGNFTDNTAHTWTVNSNAAGALTLNATCTITSGGKTFPGGVTLSGTTTKTLSGNWAISGLLTISGLSQTINATTAETLTCSGGVTVAIATLTGTAKFVLTGGTWTGNQALFNDIDLQGNVTISATVQINAKTLTYVSGTITTTSSTLAIAGSGTTTLNVAAVSWNNITQTGSGTISLSAALTVSGTLTQNGTGTWTGTGAFTCANYILAASSAATITFNHLNTYTITSSFTCNKSVFTSTVTFTSDDGTLKAPLTLNNGATCNVIGNFTRIDASAGRAIYAFNGTVTTCNNIFSFNDALPPAQIISVRAAASY